MIFFLNTVISSSKKSASHYATALIHIEVLTFEGYMGTRERRKDLQNYMLGQRSNTPLISFYRYFVSQPQYALFYNGLSFIFYEKLTFLLTALLHFALKSAVGSLNLHHEACDEN